MIENETNQTMYFVFVGADSLRRSMGQEQPTLFFTGSCLSWGRTRASLWPIGRNPPDLSRGDGSQIYVGKWNHGFSVIPVEPYLEMFWRMSTDVPVEGYRSLYGDVDAMLTKENVLVGLSLLPEVTDVTCLFYSMADEVEDLKR